jgi:phosphoribosylglycinamide formyltransferase-1
VLSPTFLGAFRDRVINIHPALLPMFPGSHAQRQALDYGVKVTGCTVHFVDEGVDTGPIILQKVVEVRDDDDETSLSERLLSHEHEALIQTLELLEQQRIRLERRAGAARPRVVTKPQ